jgi:hypothetical protein
MKKTSKFQQTLLWSHEIYTHEFVPEVMTSDEGHVYISLNASQHIIGKAYIIAELMQMGIYIDKEEHKLVIF